MMHCMCYQPYGNVNYSDKSMVLNCPKTPVLSACTILPASAEICGQISGGDTHPPSFSLKKKGSEFLNSQYSSWVRQSVSDKMAFSYLVLVYWRVWCMVRNFQFVRCIWEARCWPADFAKPTCIRPVCLRYIVAKSTSAWIPFFTHGWKPWRGKSNTMVCMVHHGIMHCESVMMYKVLKVRLTYHSSVYISI